MRWTNRASLNRGLLVLIVAATLGAGFIHTRQAPVPMTARVVSAQATEPACQSTSQVFPAAMDAATAIPAVAQALSDFNQGIPDFQTMNNLASLTVAIVHDQDIIYSRSFGCADISAQSPATPQTIYAVGSVTKMMTATMLMQLRDAGKLQLNDPVNKYVSEAQYRSPSGMTISPTFQELASHSSGLPRDATTIPTTNAQLFQELQMTTALSEPGTTFLYSNFGYAVLGQVLAEIAGQPYEQYVEQNILQPLGMTSSGFTPPSGQAPQAGWATPYMSVTSTAQGVQADAQPWLTFGPYFPALGMFSTALDMAQFIMLQFRTGPAGGSMILSGSTLKEMQQQVISGEPALVGVGTGWEIYVPYQTITWIGKDGVEDGFQAQMLFVPSANVGVFAIANTASTSDPNLGQLMLSVTEQVMVRLAPPIEQANAAE